MLWHDYECWGVSPRQDWPCQFAAVRTDLSLNELKSAAQKPMNWFCRIPNDQLPHPEACLVTGITPQQSLRDGYIEADFVAKIHAEMIQPETCVCGYNSIRFDDEVTRFALFRNFYDPYAREWKNGNSRWDIIDLVRACYALRPDGVVWPQNEQGSPSFKLEHLTQANQLDHGDAHDALSDVHATIALARLIEQQQPKLYEYAFAMRHKQTVLARLKLQNMQPLVHISGMYKADRGCCSIILPIGFHPQNNNALICVDLLQPIESIINVDVDTLRQRLYTKTEDLEHANQRPGIRTLHINKSPFIAPLNTLSEARATALGIDINTAVERATQLSTVDGLVATLTRVFEADTHRDEEPRDIDQSLYSDGFASTQEKNWAQQVIDAPPETLHLLSDDAPSARLKHKLFRYRARNYPQTLTASELERWQAFRQARLFEPDSPNGINAGQYMQEIELLAERTKGDANKQAILRALVEYAQNL
ncbi:exodeoxyribonuclease I [Alteromonas sp. SM 2104]|nr:exodeoxyribonuclease I [Alteromonas oceanisediminis]